MIATFSPSRHSARPAAFTLVEVTLALGIAVFALVVMFGLLNVGVASSSASFEQTVATNILSSVAADLRGATKGAATTSNVYGLAIPAAAAAGATPTTTALAPVYLDASGQPKDASGATITGAKARYRLNVWTSPGADRQATLVRVMISWPPLAANPAGSVETLVALDRN